MRKIKLIILALCLVSISFVVKAQDGLEFASIEYVPQNAYQETPIIYISINGVEFIEITLEPISKKSDQIKDHEKGSNPLIKQILEMSKDGWTVMSFDSEFSGVSRSHMAYLSRKKE